MKIFEKDRKLHEDDNNVYVYDGTEDAPVEDAIVQESIQVESVETTSLSSEELNWLVVATSIDPTPDKGADREFRRVVGAFSMLIHAEDFINKCLPKDRKDAFQIVTRSGKAVQENKKQVVEKSSSASQVSKMTRKGTRIPNPSWAQFDAGSYVMITAPQNPALDLEVASKAGRVVGKVKDTYVYSSDNKTNQMGRDNDFKSELDASAPQSCLVEIHDDYKIKQHGEATNRIIIPTEWLSEINEKQYKDSINAIPRKGLNKLFNKDKKRIESVEMRKFKFRCRKCGNEFVDEYDYPLPTDCNACVTCPKCGGTACIKDSEPLEESKLKSKKGIGNEPLKEGLGNFNVSEPSNFAPNGRSYFDKPKDWEEKHEWVKQQLEPKGYTCVGSSSWNSTWSNGNAIDEIVVDYWEDFDCIKEIIEMTLRSI